MKFPIALILGAVVCLGCEEEMSTDPPGNPCTGEAVGQVDPVDGHGHASGGVLVCEEDRTQGTIIVLEGLSHQHTLTLGPTQAQAALNGDEVIVSTTVDDGHSHRAIWNPDL